MKTCLIVTVFFAATSLAVTSFAQPTTTSPAPGGKVTNTPQVAAPAQPGTGQHNAADMMKQMMELSKLKENHKLLSSVDGNSDYSIKFWMKPDRNVKAHESKRNAN